MRILLVLFIIFLYKFSSGGDAHSSHDGTSKSSAGQDQKYRVLKEFTHSNARVWLIVREAGHMVGQPFQVELRVQCDPSKTGVAVMDIPVKDSFSVCDVKPESILVNSDQTGVAMKTKSVDITDYDNQILSATADIKPKCAEGTTIKHFSLEGLCAGSG